MFHAGLPPASGRGGSDTHAHFIPRAHTLAACFYITPHNTNNTLNTLSRRHHRYRRTSWSLLDHTPHMPPPSPRADETAAPLATMSATRLGAVLLWAAGICMAQDEQLSGVSPKSYWRGASPKGAATCNNERPPPQPT